MSTPTVVVAGATGNLGGRIVKALLRREAHVRALVRPGTAPVRLERLQQPGVTITPVNLSATADLAAACRGASCVVSALQGLRDVIVDVQSALLEGALRAGVPRFIPSDYSIDFTGLPAGRNRNLDLRRDFLERLDVAGVAATTIFNGAFADMLTGPMPLILFKLRRVLCWGNADQRMDFTTIDDTAAFAARAALDPSTPRFLRIAGDELSARELAVVASEVTGETFRVFRVGGLTTLDALIKLARAVAPGKGELFPPWQGMQYMRDMFDGRAKLEPLDNDRYPGMRWTTAREVLSRHRASPPTAAPGARPGDRDARPATGTGPQPRQTQNGMSPAARPTLATAPTSRPPTVPGPARDVLIVGAGPAGLAVSIAAQKTGLGALIVEKGALVNSIAHFPAGMTFFTTPELLEIGGLPFVTPYEKPTRGEALRYYRRAADTYRLEIAFDERVETIVPDGDAFLVRSRCLAQGRAGTETRRRARHVVLATGYYDQPNRLGVPGEDLPHVSHYYDDPHPCYRKHVVVVGGKNSAAIAALELYRAGAASVTLVHRGPAISSSVKYWIKPDVENRIKEGSVRAFFETRVCEIRPDRVVVQGPGGGSDLPADAVFLLTGYLPDTRLLRDAGVRFDPESLRPEHDPDTYETNVCGVFVAGSIVSGRDTNRTFIENGRFHGEAIVAAIRARRASGG